MQIPGQSPLALIGCSEMWMSHALETVFEQRGYVVALTRSAAQTIRLARRTPHDVVVVDETLEDMSAIELCRTLRDGPSFDHSTPIIVSSPRPVTRAYTLRALSAGAWDYCSNPIDFEMIFMKLETFIRARRESAVAQAQSFLDPATGLYSAFGLHQLAEQLGARALRKHEPFACVAIEPDVRVLREEKSVPIDRLQGFADVANIFRLQSRKSDIVGVTGESRLSILAPDTDAQGARLLVARLQTEVDRAHRNKSIGVPIRLRAGYSAVRDLADAHINVDELAQRAETALTHLPAGATGTLIASFDDISSN